MVFFKDAISNASSIVISLPIVGVAPLLLFDIYLEGFDASLLSTLVIPNEKRLLVGVHVSDGAFLFNPFGMGGTLPYY